MKTKVLVSAFLLVISPGAFAQWVNLWNNNNITTKCFASGTDTCYVSGSNGIIYRTTNGGASWDSTQTIFEYSWFLDIDFPSSKAGYACGGTAFGNYKSVIAKTINGGETWDSISSNQFGYDLNTVHFINDSIGFFGGNGLVVKTTDGGTTLKQTDLPFFGNINDIFFTSANTGFMAGNGEIAKTTDQGESWVSIYFDSVGINSLFFTDSNTGFAAGSEGVFLKTTDGGTTWNKTIIANDSIFLREVQFLDNNTGYIAASRYQVGGIGYIFKTTDGGNTWTQQAAFEGVSLSSISMATANIGYAAGYSSVYKTTNGGTNSIKSLLLSEPSFTVYPNPAGNNCTILLKEQKAGNELKIYDSKGALLKTIKIMELQSMLDIGSLSNGIYSLVLTTGSGEKAWQQNLIITK